MPNNKLIRNLFISLSLCLSMAALCNMNVNAKEDSIEDKLFKKIEAAGGVNNLEKVKDDIKRVLKLNPRHAGATYYAGQYSFQKGNFENAEKFLNRIIDDPVYGSKANSLLADIRMKKYSSRFMGTLKVYLSGESFSQALQLCEEALVDMPDSKELLFSASYASCMLGKKERAESYSELYTAATEGSELSAELKTLVDAWFTDSFDNDVAIEKFLSLKNKKLLTPIVKRRIKKLLIDSKSIDRYEEFVKKEVEQPGADKDALERELITFLLEQNQFNKAIALINKRPIESLEDNLLYIWALCATEQHIKALDVAHSLMSVAPRDLRVYKGWAEAWLSYTVKHKEMPSGKDNTGTPYSEIIEHLFELLRPDKLVNQEPELLIDLLRIASFCGKEKEAQTIQREVAKIAFTDDHEKLLIKMADELVAFNRDKMAINILESAANQLPDNYNVTLKLAQTYIPSNPSAAILILEEAMQQWPDLVRAFTLWCDAMNANGRGGEAITEIVKRLEDESLNDLVKRQLNLKLETLRMQGNDDEPYTPATKEEIKERKNQPPAKEEVVSVENSEIAEDAEVSSLDDEDEIPGDDLLEAITASDNLESYTPPKEFIRE